MEDDGASFGVKKVGQERKLSEREHLSRPSSICVSPRMIYGCRLLLLLPPSSTVDGVFALVLCIGGICRFYYYFTLYTHSNEELLRTNKPPVPLCVSSAHFHFRPPEVVGFYIIVDILSYLVEHSVSVVELMAGWLCQSIQGRIMTHFRKGALRNWMWSLFYFSARLPFLLFGAD